MLRKTLIFIGLLFFLHLHIVSAYNNKDLECENKFPNLPTIATNIVLNAQETTLIHSKVICKDTDSIVVDVYGRYLYKEKFRIDFKENIKVGDQYIFPFSKNMLVQE